MITENDELHHLAILSQQGDREAYRRFLLAAAALARRHFSRRILSSEEKEDLIQECLVSVHRSLDTFDPTRAVSPWITAMAEHRFADFKRIEMKKKGLFATPPKNWDGTETDLTQISGDFDWLIFQEWVTQHPMLDAPCGVLKKGRKNLPALDPTRGLLKKWIH